MDLTLACSPIPLVHAHADLCKCACRDTNLHFVEQVALAPPEVQIDHAQQAAYEQQLATAMAQPLPDEDEELAE